MIIRTSARQDSDFAREVFSNILEEVVEWVADNLEPEDVYDPDRLEDWAEANGYVKKTEEDGG